MTSTKVILGFLTFVIAATLITITWGDYYKIDFGTNVTTYSIHEGLVWKVVAKDFNQLISGTSVLKPIKAVISNSIKGNFSTVSRMINYSNGIVLIDSAIYDGNVKDITKIPINRTITILNAKGKKYQYIAYELPYKGPKKELHAHSYAFGNVKITWQPGYLSVKIGDYLKNNSLVLTYNITSNNQIFNIRLFDPPSYCYQETANISTICGGLDTGSYYFTNDSSSDHVDNYLYVNYTKPFNFVSAIWQVKHGNYTTIPYNITLPIDCLSNNDIQLRILSKRVSSFNTSSQPSCYNGSIWKEIGNLYVGQSASCSNDPGSENKMIDGNWGTSSEYDYFNTNWMSCTGIGSEAFYIFEEAMWWNINIQSVTLQTPLNNSIYGPGDMIFNFSVFDQDYDIENCSLILNGQVNQTINSEGMCYQEFANISTDCGGKNTGDYVLDGDTVYINYTKPDKIENNSIWQIKIGQTIAEQNISIPFDCWNYNSENLSFKMVSIPTPSSSEAYCYNGTWKLVYITPSLSGCANGAGGMRKFIDGIWTTGSSYLIGSGMGDNAGGIGARSCVLWEEAMWWNISVISNGQYSFNPVNLSVGDYLWTVNCSNNISDIIPAGIDFLLHITQANVDCSSNPVINSDMDLGDQNLTLSGIGTYTVNAVITAKGIVKENGCNISIGSGGKFVIG